MYSQRVVPFYLSFSFAVLGMEPSSLPAICFYYFTVCSEGMHADTLYKLSAVLYKVSLVVEHGPRQGIKHWSFIWELREAKVKTHYTCRDVKPQSLSS